MPVSVMPRPIVLVPSTHMVLRKSSQPRVSSIFRRAPLWPNAFSVARPWMESRKSAANARYDFDRARLAAASLLVLQRRRDQRDERRDEQHDRDRQVEERDEREDDDRRQRGHRELRQVLAEIHLELLHALDHRHDHLARARPGDVRGTERDDVVVDGLAEPLLHERRRAMGHRRACVLEEAAHDDRRRDERHGTGELRERVAREDAREQPAEQGESRNAGDDLQEAEHDGRGDASTHTCREREEPGIEIHRR